MGRTIINGYHLITEFTNSNAGMCQWAFAQKNGRDYFLKQLLFPKYPTPATEKKLSPTLVSAMKAEAEAYSSQRRRFFAKLQECQTGNVIYVQDFFREDEFYYLVTERVFGPFLSVEEIRAMTADKKLTLFKAILYSIMQIHDRGIVHSDLKPENIMIRRTSAGYCTAKLIDFDSGFFEYETPDEIIGDQRYFSPEAVLRNDERDVPVTVKSDIFALGLLFHQYWCGDFPGYDRDEYDSASIALLNREPLQLDPSIPEDVSLLIGRMLSKHQEDRPTAKEAWMELGGKPAAPPPPKVYFGVPTDDDL